MGRLFAVVVTVIALVSAAIFALHVWWLPPDISAHGGRIDRQLNETMVTAGILFVAAQLALGVFVWRFGDPHFRKELSGLYFAKARSQVRATCRASSWNPLLKAGCPQQVCVGGTKTSAPPASSSLIAAKPIDGRTRSMRQVTKKPTRMLAVSKSA